MLELLLCGLLHASPVQSSDIDVDEEVVLFSTAAQRIDATTWEIPAHGWIFEPEGRRANLELFRRAIGLADIPADADGSLFARRAAAFLVDNERGHLIQVRLGERTFLMNASRPNGHFEGVIRVTDDELCAVPASSPTAELTDAGRAPDVTATPPAIRSIHMVAVTSADDGRRFVGHAYLIERAGVSVISDIDDTIKISEVRTKKALLRNTFLEPFRAVDGMADVYRRWIDSHGTAFHYVTASPWQLYEPLRGFLEDAGFPSGTLHMKPFRWKDEAFLSLFESPEKYKPDVIDSLVARFPRRRFVLVGDSGEKDPEIYGAAARKHEKQIVAILIRDVTQESADGPRYKECFAGLSRELWRIFRDPVEIRAALDGIAVSPSDNPRGDRR